MADDSATAAAAAIDESERIAKRAAKFGVPMTEEEKQALRMKKFGIPQPQEEEKKKATRVARFQKDKKEKPVQAAPQEQLTPEEEVEFFFFFSAFVLGLSALRACVGEEEEKT
jgi:hypothetical protein